MVLCAGSAAAAEPSELGQYHFRTYGVEQGLDNAVVLKLLQDDQDFLWAATDDGAFRFDGHHFLHVDAALGLPATTVSLLAGGTQGAPVWFGTARGLARWTGERAIPVRGDQGLPEINIEGLAVGSDGQAWVGTSQGLFHQVGPDRFEPAPGWPGGRAGAIWIDGDSSPVVVQGRDLLQRTGPAQWHRIGAQQGLGRELLNAVARDASGTLWARSRARLWRQRPGETRFETVAIPFDLLSEDGHLALDREGRLWLPSDSGAFRRDGSGWKPLTEREGLPRGGVRDLIEDREGSLWFAMTGHLHQLLGRGLWRSVTASDGLPGEVVWAPYRDPEGRLWAGTNRGLARATERGFRVVPGTERNVIRSIAVDAQGALWAGGVPTEVLRIDPRTLAVTRFGSESGLSGDKVLVVRTDQEGTLWVGTEGDGLYRRATAPGGRVHFERVVPDGCTGSERVASLAEDGEGRLWATGQCGLSVRERDGRWRRLTQHEGLRTSWVAYVTVRQSGEVCAAYAEPQGVACFRLEGDRLIGLHHLDGDGSAGFGKIYSLGEDAAGRLWIGTGNGLDIVSPDGIEHFGTPQGLPSDDATAMAIFSDPGAVWFGTSAGLGVFDVARYQPRTEIPKAAILEVRIAGKPAPAGGPEPSVPYSRSSLEVRYAALSFLDNERIRYEVRLEPEEPEPHLTGSTEAQYGGLSEGPHVFEVRARLPNGSLGPVSRYRFTVLPAWWQTSWARGAALLLAAGLLILALSWRARALGARQAREALARSEQGFRTLIEASPDAILVLRGDAIAYANPSAAAALGFAHAAELVGLSMQQLIHPEDREVMAERLRAVGQSRKPAALREERLLRRDGEVRTFEIAALAAEFDGAPCVLAVARDVSERKRLEARLLLADRMASVGTLASGVAHEINNPLAYLQANLEWSLETLQQAQRLSEVDQAALQQALVEAADGADRVRKIVGGLRTFARAPQQAAHAVVDLRDTLESAIKLVANQVRHRANLVRDFSEAPQVRADPAQLTQVFVNLIVNAAQAIPDGHAAENSIRLVVRTDAAGRALAEVEDTGVGIPREMQSRIFDPFFTTKAVGVGTGLGLSICHSIVAGLGGEITVFSEPGRGTTFRVVLPAADARQELQTPPEFRRAMA